MASDNAFKKLRIAIPCAFANSFFSSGLAQATYALAAGFKGIGHDVTIIQISERTWFDDCASIKDEFPIVPYTEFVVRAATDPVDLFIDMEGGILPERKRPYALRVATFFHRLPFLTEMEQTLFAAQTSLRSMDGVDVLMTWDSFHSQNGQMYEVMYKKPVIFVPFNWYHKAVAAYIGEAKIPSWISVSASASASAQTKEWNCHIAETNQTMSSSSVLPLVITAQIAKKKILQLKDCFVHNSDNIKNNEFFKKNVHDHCTQEGLTYHYVGRQRVADWRALPRSFVLSHNRFLVVKPALLDIVWAGIPIIHNSPWLRDVGNGLEQFYYEDNDIEGACAAVVRMKADFEAKSGYFATGSQEERQKVILQKLFYSENILYRWGEVLAKVLAAPKAVYEGKVEEKPKVALKGVTFEEAKAKPEEVAKKPEESAKKPEESCSKIQTRRPTSCIRIGFSDMWDQFNPSYNFFTLLLEAACIEMAADKKPNIIGIDASVDSDVDLLIFGPFGDRWKAPCFKDIPKAHFTGENTEPVKGEGVFLNMGYKQMRGDDAGYVRLPLWMLEIDWFGADADRIQNPKPLPLASVMSVEPSVLEAKDRFCAFVVTNPRNEMRNNAFHWLSKYKRVDSAGRLFNNIGPEIYAGLGGGGGELKKHAFLKKYKFCLTYENEMCEGYTTEKILHAKAAGCVPIYWGDPLVERDFDGAGFLNANGVRTEEELVALVKKVEEDPEAWRRMASVPALDPYRRDLVRRRLSYVASAILHKLGYDVSSVPRFLGSAEGAQASAQAEGAQASAQAENKTDLMESTIGNSSTSSIPHYVTYSNTKFLPHLLRYITSLNEHNLQATVFFAPDVSPTVVEQFRTVYPQHTYVALQTSDVSLPNFADFWDPQHYAWKPYVLQRINGYSVEQSNSYSGKLIVYLDCASVVVRQPGAWLAKARAHGLCLLEDPRQRNRTWCHEEFCRALEVTDAEKDAHQIVGGIIAFVAGSPAANTFFAEAWRWAQQRGVIVGDKWVNAVPNSIANTIGNNGVLGHRHDQSIFSIVRLRQGVPVEPLDSVYCDHSRALTERVGAAYYVHRGNYVEWKPVLPGIDDACIINLKRRGDRLEKFRSAHPEWSGLVRVHEAVDGRALEMTPAVAALFKPNDFHWKKAVLGCALSHLGVWKGIVNGKVPENSTIGNDFNCLVLEDDVLFKGDFLQRWPAAAAMIPADYDILYLGGVLPPNKPAFEKLLEPVNAHWSRVKEHTLFGQREPNRYFHFCNYSYIMRKSAAQKLLASIEARGGYHTSADHMICNEVSMFKHYVLTPLAAGCYQDDDPKYAQSQFNDFSRVDGFDSDLWDNDERFTVEVPGDYTIGISLVDDALASLERTSSLERTASEPEPKATEQQQKFYVIGPHKATASTLLEHSWLQWLMDNEKKGEDIGTSREHGRGLNLQLTHVENPQPETGTPIFIVQRPYVEHYRELFLRYEEAGLGFKAIHLSDEHGTDDVSWVHLAACKAVLRNYPRADLEGVAKVATVPLGWARSSGERPAPWQQTPGLPFRELIWSFHGTKWAERDAALEPLRNLPQHECVLYDNWMDVAQLGKDAYLGRMLNSMFVPCPGGVNVETFRMYEALECGAIPLYVRKAGDEAYVALLKKHMNLLEVQSWPQAVGLIGYLLQHKDVMEKYRLALLVGWCALKRASREAMHRFLAE